ncbi:hypothetical protein Tco_0840370 [Tanacetum coccineum]|uniref:Reverse transcriptase domain-containing protein n=1 Tax=Tanacetum coccineum TaxID=301880 RepID=A0ABQ5AX07_9ASTR
MREIHYHSWLSNLVAVKNHDNSLRMCVDFTDLNKSRSKDCYPLPEIDWKVESLFGCPLKCFLDAYKGYHQIQMAEEDEKKTAFHTSQGVYCYTKMPFSLKIVRATYQRLVNKAFERQIGQNLEQEKQLPNGEADISTGACDKMIEKTIKLGKYDISNRPRISIRGQILADFIAEKLDKDPSSADMPAEEEVPEL